MHPAMSTPTAPAKINLFLHVGSPRADGYHPIESLVAFASCGDDLRFTRGGDAFTIEVDGPFAIAAGDPGSNLVLKAASALKRKVPGIGGGAFQLTKNLPAGAGLGGGSSDAAAALRLLAHDNDLATDDPTLREAARETGADVLVCLDRKARLVSGIGDVLSEPIVLPCLHAVLVWPASAASTPAVYRAFDEAEIKRSTAFGIRTDDIPRERDSLLRFIARQSNDLTRAAWHVTPRVAEADAALRAIDRAILVRMSGSGSTVFAIYETMDIAEQEAVAVRAKYPDWWVKAVTLS